MCFLVYALIVCAWLCVTNCLNYIRGSIYIEKENARVEKRNLRSSGNERMVRDFRSILIGLCANSRTRK